MSSATKPAADNLAKTEQCKRISYRFSMGIGRMRQIATKVVVAQEGVAVAEELNLRSGQAVIVTTAKKSELRSQKRLIDSPELDEIRSQDGKLKKFVEQQSAYAGESQRFVLQTEVEHIWKVMEAYRTIRRPELVAAFMQKYRDLEAVEFKPLAEALGDQFDRGDYKSSDEVEAGFDFWYSIHDVGHISLTGVSSAIVDQERQKEREQRASAVEDFKHVLRATLVKFVESLFNQVKPNTDGKRRCFQDSCVENVLTFVSNFEKQDMAQDAEMLAVVKSLKGVLKGITPEMVKESSNLQATLTAKLTEVKSVLGSLVQETGRKFR